MKVKQILNFLDIITNQHLGKIYNNIYTVMQSDGNTFYGDVVLDSFNKASRDEDNILDQI